MRSLPDSIFNRRVQIIQAFNTNKRYYVKKEDGNYTWNDFIKDLERFVNNTRAAVEEVISTRRWDPKLAPLIVPLQYNVYEPAIIEKLKRVNFYLGNTDTKRIGEVFVTRKPKPETEIVTKGRRKRKKNSQILKKLAQKMEIGGARRRRRTRRTRRSTRKRAPRAFTAWRNFLKRMGGKGYTREELSRMYHRQYDKRGKRKKRRTYRGRGYETEDETEEVYSE